MEFEPAEYVRKSFNVKAAEVTYENIEAIATWCKGTVETESTKILGGNEVKLPVIKFAGQGEDRGKELIARLGSFVVYSKGRFRVYKAPQFHAAFIEREVAISSVSISPENKTCSCDDTHNCGPDEVHNPAPVDDENNEVEEESVPKDVWEKTEHPHGIMA